jgi:hypothetical protein
MKGKRLVRASVLLLASALQVVLVAGGRLALLRAGPASRSWSP